MIDRQKLASLPKLADRNFVIGFLLPILIAALAALVLYRDVEPTAQIWKGVLHGKSFTDLTLLAVGIWSSAVLLLMCKDGLYQLLEGYRGPFRWGNSLDRMRAKFDFEVTKLESLDKEIRESKEMAFPDTKREYYMKMQEFYERFPYERHLVLPTWFGNTIRAFETYSLKVYNVDSIPAWLRIAGVIPKSVQTQIENVRAETDFFVNLWFLSILFAVLAGLRSGYDFIMRKPGEGVVDLAVILVALLTASGAYKGAIARARSWGGLVKSAFDLYLGALAKQLGYRLPEREAERRDFWDAVNSMFLYLTPIIPEKWPRAEPELVGQLGLDDVRQPWGCLSLA